MTAEGGAKLTWSMAAVAMMRSYRRVTESKKRDLQLEQALG
jgi:hypothetical protein